MDLEKHVEVTGWKGSVVILDQTIQELRFFYSQAFQLNGSPISSSLTNVRTDSILPGAVSKSHWILALRHDASTKIVSDLLAFKAAVIVLENTNMLLTDLTLSFKFDEFEKLQSIERS